MEFSIRDATPGDKQAVLDCHPYVYEGLDYLPEFYDYFMTATHIKAFVLLHGETIIGFNAGMIIDDDMTMVSRGARVNPEYEVQGLYRMLDDKLALWAKSHHVTVKAQTTTEHNKVVSRPSFKKKNQRVFSRSMFRGVIEETVLQQIKAVDEETVAAVSDNLLAEYIISHSAYLFPKGRIIIDFVSYLLLASNVPFMTKPFTEVFSNIHFDSGRHKGLLSFGTSFKVPAFASRYTIDVYGSDTGSFEKHVQKHLSRLKQKAGGTCAVLVFADESFPVEIIEEVLQKYGVIKDRNSPRRQFLFEMQL